MKFEWNEDKNIANHAKHKIWFEEAQTVWADHLSEEFYDSDNSEIEDRFIRIGHSTAGRTLLVVFCERQSGDIIRIISARRASKKERTDYEKGI
jgi:uncharacterized protein